MTIKLPSDHLARRQAIDPRGSFLVQAPAGSGKTELLTDRILALLGTVNRPEEIVAITFTRKAAAEMHARVLEKLQSASGPQPSEPHRLQSWQLAVSAMARDRQLGWNLLDYPARLSIRTIDSFCAHLVRCMPWVSSLGGMPRIAEDPGKHYLAAANDTLDQAESQPVVQRFLDHMDVDLATAQSLLAQMLADRDHWQGPLAGDSESVLVDNLDQLLVLELKKVRAAMPVGWETQIGGALIAAANTALADGRECDLVALADWSGESLQDDPHSLPGWRGVADALLTAGGDVRRRLDKTRGFVPDSDQKKIVAAWLEGLLPGDPCVQALHGVRALPQGYTADQQETIRTLVQVLRLAGANLQRRFSLHGEVDFSEITDRALMALGRSDDPSDLLLALDSAIRHILVDEFQDTSRRQIELLEKLTAGWQPQDGRTLFLVGDPMQSIYRFRKADVGGFLRVRDEGIGDIRLTPLELSDNFRSRADVVTWVNQTCAAMFPACSDPDLGAITYTASVPFNGAADGAGVHFHPLWRQDAGSPPPETPGIDDDQAELAVELAARAFAAHDRAEHPVAILVRARSHLQDIVQRLVRRGVPCRAVELVTLKTRQVVNDLVQLARALAHPGDRLAWLATLRSPLCGLRLASLHDLFGADHARTIPAIMADWLQNPDAARPAPAPDEARRLRRAAAVLLDPANSSGRLPFAAWLSRQWEQLGGFRIYSRAEDREDAEQVFRLVEKLAPYGALDPVLLEERLDSLYAASTVAGRAVEVMTIHKSKGLEFETVVLVGLERPARPDSLPLLSVDTTQGRLVLGPVNHRGSADKDPVAQYLAHREKLRGSYEADRLLYVALTRARHALHLVARLAVDGRTGEVKPPPRSALLARIWDYVLVPPPPAVAAPANGGGETPALSTLQSSSGGRPLVRPVLQAVQESGPLPSRSPGSGQAWQWRPADVDDALLGTVAHAWLERLGKQGIDQWTGERILASDAVFRRQLSRAGLPAERLDAGVQVLRDTLAATLSSPKGRWLLTAAQAYREWSLLDLDGRVSVIDLAISFEDDWLVVDYKTGIPRPGESPDAFAERMRLRYAGQLQRYCDHVKALDGRAARGVLYFPRADLWLECADA